MSSPERSTRRRKIILRCDTVRSCLIRSSPTHQTVSYLPIPSHQGFAPYRVDDPWTSAPDDYWLHPCDCAPPAWGMEKPVSLGCWGDFFPHLRVGSQFFQCAKSAASRRVASRRVVSSCTTLSLTLVSPKRVSEDDPNTTSLL